MTTIDEKTNVCIFHWNIKNFRHCYWLGEEVLLVSPAIKGWHGTEWYLTLFPVGSGQNSIGFSVNRASQCGPSRIIEVKFHLAFLTKEGSVLNGVDGEHEFGRGDGTGRGHFVSRERVFFTDREKFLPEGTLTVQCTLQEIRKHKDYEVAPVLKHVYALSVLKVNRRSVVWKIADFSTLNSSVKNEFRENLIELDLILNKDILEMNVISYDKSVKCISVNIGIKKPNNTMIGIIDGRKTRWSIFAIRDQYNAEFKGTYYIAHLPDKKLLVQKCQRTSGVLSFDIEYAYTTLTSNSHEFSCPGILPGEEKSKNAPVLIDCLNPCNPYKSMYTDGVFSDTKLCTSSRTFPAHRGILSVRSPVFSRMFNSDMTEKSSGCVNITDLEDDTVHRMLLFMYTDSLEDLQFESALKLYEAADKYEIFSLKSRCSSFLRDNMCPIEACRVLVLADMHQDEYLKRFVQAYILKDDNVFSLEEWKHFVEKYPKLAADIMKRKNLSNA